MFDLINIFDTFLPQLLLYPNPTDPLNGEAARLMLKDETKYKERIKEYIKKYASDNISLKENGNKNETKTTNNNGNNGEIKNGNNHNGNNNTITNTNNKDDANKSESEASELYNASLEEDIDN